MIKFSPSARYCHFSNWDKWPVDLGMKSVHVLSSCQPIRVNYLSAIYKSSCFNLVLRYTFICSSISSKYVVSSLY